MRSERGIHSVKFVYTTPRIAVYLRLLVVTVMRLGSKEYG